MQATRRLLRIPRPLAARGRLLLTTGANSIAASVIAQSLREGVLDQGAGIAMGKDRAGTERMRVRRWWALTTPASLGLMLHFSCLGRKACGHLLVWLIERSYRLRCTTITIHMPSLPCALYHNGRRVAAAIFPMLFHTPLEGVGTEEVAAGERRAGGGIVCV